MNPRGQGVDDDLVNLGLVLVAAVGALAALLRARRDSGLLAGRRRTTTWRVGRRLPGAAPPR